MSQSEPYMPERRFPWIKAILLTLLLLLLVLIGGYWLKGRSAENKLLALAEEYRQKGEPIYPQDFAQPALPAADNAVIDLRAAVSAITLTEEQKRIIFDLSHPALPLTDKEAEVLHQALDANAEVLRLVRAAAAKPGINWNLPLKSPVFTMMLPDLRTQRELAQVLRAAAIHAHHVGDEPAVLQHIESLLFLARALDKQPILVSHLVATGIRAIACECILEIAPDLLLPNVPTTQPAAKPADRQRVQALIAQLLDDETPRAGLIHGLRGERMGQLDTARQLASGQMTLAQLGGGGPSATRIPGHLFKPFILQDGVFMLSYTSQVIDAAGEPNLPAAEPKMPDRDLIPRTPLHITAQMLLPALGAVINRSFRATADRRAAATALAIRLYAADHAGQLPATLSELVPTYLPTLPLDPFTSDKPLGYRPHATDPILYSVGDDGIDDGGDASPTRSTNRDPSRWECRDAVYSLTRQPRKPVEEDLPADTDPMEDPAIADPPPATAPAAP